MAYRCVATSVAGFVQQLAVAYVARGYWFYVPGKIPEGKDPARTDAKIIAQYGLDMSRWTRARRKRVGQASVQYLRHGHFHVILATHGEHPFFAAEGKQIRDVRRCPLHFRGYVIGCRNGRDGRRHASVRIERERFQQMKAHFEEVAVHRRGEDLYRELRGLPFEPYAPVRDQMRILLRAVNRRRKAAGLDPVPPTALRLRRRSRRAFADQVGD